MKKIRLLLAVLLALLCVLALTAFRTDDTTDFSPKTTPQNGLMTTVSTYDFTKNGFDRIYNNEYSADTYALGYGKVTEGANTRYFISTCGGGYNPQLLAYAANGDDLSGATWVSLYVDTTDLQTTDGFSIGMRLYLANTKKVSSGSTSVLAPLHPKNGAFAAYYTADGVWQTAKIADGKLPLPKDFCGYVAFQLSSFSHAKEENKKYFDNCKTFADLVGAGHKYLGRVHLFTAVGDTYESQTDIRIDDLTFFSSGDAHSHTFTKGKTVAPTCTEDGYTVHTCDGCGVSIQTDVTESHGHNYGAYKADTDGVAYRICASCAYVETNAEITATAKGKDDLVTVTFDFGDAGGKQIVKLRKGDTLTKAHVPRKMTYQKRYIYQFNCWTSDKGNICPKNPVGMTVTEDVTFYARWLIANYANKYIGAASIVSTNGGAYTWEEGRVIVYGNSNMSLYHGLETAFANDGVPVYNNSIAGSTSYEMIEYFKACVLTYKPKAILTNVTTNDMAYYNMSEKQILENMKTMYEMVREYLPDTVLFITSGNPLPGRTEYTQTIERVNYATARFCYANTHCEFVNSYPKVLAFAKEYPTGWDTWTHMDQAHLTIVFDDARAQIKAYFAK